MTFGDLPLMSESIHTCSLTSSSFVQLIVIDRLSFFDLFKSLKLEKLNESRIKSSNIDFLQTIPLFNNWPLNLLAENSQVIKTCVFCRNQVISKDTHSSKYIYVVKSGYLSIWTKFNIYSSDSQDNLSESPIRSQKNDKETNDGYFKKNELLETHHINILRFHENTKLLKSANDSDRLKDIESKIRLIEINNFLSSNKKRDRETREAINMTDNSKFERKVIKTLPNGTTYYYRDELSKKAAKTNSSK